MEVSTTENKPLVTKYGIVASPSLILMDDTGKMLDALHGYKELKEVRPWLRTAAILSRHADVISGKASDPEDAPGYREAADAYMKIPDIGRALPLYGMALELNDKRKTSRENKVFKGQTLMFQAMSHALAGGSILLFADHHKKVAELDPDGKLGLQDEALLLKALSAMFGGLRADPVPLLNEGLKKYPKSNCRDGYLFLRGIIELQGKQDKEKAFKTFGEIRDQYPDSFYSWAVDSHLGPRK